MELAQGVVEACAAAKSPVILQISKGARAYANIRFLRKIIDACVEEYPDVPIAIHCDHGDTIELIQACVADGYTSVMIDGSHHPYEENVALSAEAVKLAHASGVVVEAELGMLGGIEEDVVGLDAAEYEKQYRTVPHRPRTSQRLCCPHRYRQPRGGHRYESRSAQIRPRSQARVRPDRADYENLPGIAVGHARVVECPAGIC